MRVTRLCRPVYQSIYLIWMIAQRSQRHFDGYGERELLPVLITLTKAFAVFQRILSCLQKSCERKPDHAIILIHSTQHRDGLTSSRAAHNQSARLPSVLYSSVVAPVLTAVRVRWSRIPVGVVHRFRRPRWKRLMAVVHELVDQQRTFLTMSPLVAPKSWKMFG